MNRYLLSQVSLVAAFVTLLLFVCIPTDKAFAETSIFRRLEWIAVYDLIAMADAHHIYIFSQELQLVDTIYVVNSATSTDKIQYFDWSPDGSLFVVVLNVTDGRSATSSAIQIWDFPTRQMRDEITDYSGLITAWHPESSYLAIENHPLPIENEVVIVDIDDSSIVNTLPLDTLPYSIVWHPDGEHLITGLPERFLVWDIAPQPPQFVTIEAAEYNAGSGIIFSPSGDQFLTASSPLDELEIWDFQSLQPEGSIEDFNDLIEYFMWSNTGILTTSLDEITTLWDDDTGSVISTLQTGIVTDIAWSTDNTKLVMETLNESITIRDLASGEILAQLDTSSLNDDP